MRLLDIRQNRSTIYKLLLILLMAFNVCAIIVLMNKKDAMDSVSSIGRVVFANESKRIVVLDKTHLKLDKTSDPNDTLIYEHIAQEIPNLPIEELNNIHYKNRNYNNSCAWYPSFLDIKIRNDYWQEFYNRNITYYLFGAYLDRRPTVTYDEPVVRVLTMMHFIAPHDVGYPQTFCQVWYKEQLQPVISPLKELRRIWFYNWGHGSEHNYPHLLVCPISEEHKTWIPQSVSLVALPCDNATNNIRVVYEPLRENEEKIEFAVCVKGLDYPYADISHRLVEYMETMRSLGAAKITMYQLEVHPNTTKVLKYYEKTGFLEYRPFSLSTAVSNLGKYRHLELAKNNFSKTLHEVIAYNDCLYRNIYRYKYVAVVDMDEIPMPLGNFTNWHDLMQFGEEYTRPNCKHFASFCFRCIYFPKYPQKPPITDKIPEYFYMMQHVHRVKEHIRPDSATKCLHSTDRVIATHNHFAILTVWDVCVSYSFETKDAQLQHYREPPVKETLVDPVVDTSLWRYKDEVIERSMKVFGDLNFFDEIIVDDLRT